MADNVQLPVTGTGTADVVAATDDVGGVHYPFTKLATGTLGATTPIPLPDALGAGGGLKVDGSGTALPVTANAGTDLNTSALATESGGNLAGAATSLAVIDDWDESDRAKVNTIAGQVGVQGGSGGVSALTQRVVLATDVGLPAGTAALGTVQGFLVTVATDITRPANTSIYAINDAYSDSTSAPTAGGFTFTNAARQSGGSGVILDAVFVTSADLATLLQAELMLFNQAVTAINDNAAFAVTAAEAKTLIAKIPFTMEDIGNSGWYHAQNLNIGFTCAGSANLRYLIRVKNAYTPGNAEVLTCTLKILQII